MNDRALREIVSSLGGVPNGYPRETGFDITVASEVVAITGDIVTMPGLPKSPSSERIYLNDLGQTEGLF